MPESVNNVRSVEPITKGGKCVASHPPERNAEYTETVGETEITDAPGPYFGRSGVENKVKN